MENQKPNQSLTDDWSAKLRAARRSKRMQGERRIITMLFCDVTGSTSMAENLDPEEWAEIMNDAFDYMIAPIYRYEGTLARMMGDGLLAFFGAPIAHEDDPIRALMAGLDIIRDLEPFRQEVNDYFDLDFNVRIGINTGPVVVGEIGSDLAVEYTAMGDAINLAARMEETAAPGTLQITEFTHKLVAPLFEFEPIGPISVKGRGQPVNSFRVLEQRSDPGRLRGIEGLAAPLIGREDEYEQLLKVLEMLDQGQGHILVLTGNAGLGKSRLISEMKGAWAAIGHDQDSWSESRGIPYDQDRPYSQFLQRLHTAAPSGSPGNLPLGSSVEAESIAPTTSEGQAIIQDIMAVLLGGDDQTAPKLDAETMKKQLFEAIFSSWQDEAEESPKIRVFDDLHWVDPASTELIIHLLDLARSTPTLFVFATRPHETSPCWRVVSEIKESYPDQATIIDLEPMSEKDSDKLINSLLTISELPLEIRRLILSKADGNPFFVEEIIRELIETGVIIRDESGDRWQSRSLVADIEIPDNLQSLLISRIDRLDKQIKKTLQVAAVIGRSFYYRVLDIVAAAADSLSDQLNILQDADMILLSASMPEVEYMFKHELTRDAAYGTILHRQRRAYHKAVGEALESLMQDRLAEEAHSLAHHFELARDRQKSLKYNTIAGDRAKRIFANQEAINYYNKALADGRKIASSEELIHIYRNLGRTLEVSSKHHEAMERYNEMLVMGKEGEDRRIQLEALMAKAVLLSTYTPLYDPVQASEAIFSALELADELDDSRALARIYWIKMLQELFSGHDINETVASGEKSLALARELNLEGQLAYTLHDLGRPYAFSGRFEDAIAVLKEAGPLFQEQGNLQMLADNRTTLAYGYLVQGDLAHSLSLCQEAIRISQKSGSLWSEVYTRNQEGLTYFEKGMVDHALDTWSRSMAIADASNFPGGSAFVRGYMAYSFGRIGNFDAGLKLISSVIEAPTANIDVRDLNEFKFIMAPLYVGIGDTASADEIIKQARESSDDGIRTNVMVNQFSIEAMCAYWVAVEDYKRAFELASETSETMIGQGILISLPTLLCLKGQAETALGLNEEAGRTFEQAVQVAKSTGSRSRLWPNLAAAANLARAEGNEKKATKLGEEAISEISYISGNIADAKLRETFRIYAVGQLDIS